MFELTESQKAKIKVWNAEQNEIVRQRQLASDDPFIARVAQHGAYYGAIGGELTYCFSPNSIGMAVVVKHEGTGAALDVSDYDSW